MSPITTINFTSSQLGDSCAERRLMLIVKSFWYGVIPIQKACGAQSEATEKLDLQNLWIIAGKCKA